MEDEGIRHDFATRHEAMKIRKFYEKYKSRNNGKIPSPVFESQSVLISVRLVLRFFEEKHEEDFVRCALLPFHQEI